MDVSGPNVPKYCLIYACQTEQPHCEDVYCSHETATNGGKTSALNLRVCKITLKHDIAKGRRSDKDSEMIDCITIHCWVRRRFLCKQ